MSKNITLVFILILATPSMLMAGNVNAQSIPTLTVPEFTVKFVDRSYDVPVTTSQTTDPFTGQQVTHSSGGYHVENRTIDVTIKNQPFTPNTLGNGTVIQLYYSARAKGHFGNWDDARTDVGYWLTQPVLASSSGYTVITFVLGVEYWNPPVGGQEDFEVQAEAGYNYPAYYGLVPMGQGFESLAESGWSSPQTITIPATSASVPTSTPTVPEFTPLAILPLFVIIPLIVTVIIRKKGR